MTLAWPSTLPQFPLVQFDSLPNSNIIEKEFETGPIRLRKRDSVRFETHSISIIVTKEQRQTFFDFFYVDHNEGATPFEWTDPNTDSAKNFRVRNPSSRHVGAGIYEISFQLQEVPN